MTDRTPQLQDKYMLRLPDGMRDFLKEEADRNGRSLNAEIVHRLDMTINQTFNTSSLDQVATALLKKIIDAPYYHGQAQAFNDVYAKLKKQEAAALTELIEAANSIIDKAESTSRKSTGD